MIHILMKITTCSINTRKMNCYVTARNAITKNNNNNILGSSLSWIESKSHCIADVHSYIKPYSLSTPMSIEQKWVNKLSLFYVLCSVHYYHLFVAVVCMHIHIALVYMLCVYIAPYISNRRTNKNINSDKNNEFLAYFHDSSSNTNDQFCNENIFFRSHFRGNIPYSLE